MAFVLWPATIPSKTSLSRMLNRLSGSEARFRSGGLLVRGVAECADLSKARSNQHVHRANNVVLSVAEYGDFSPAEYPPCHQVFPRI